MCIPCTFSKYSLLIVPSCSKFAVFGGPSPRQIQGLQKVISGHFSKPFLGCIEALNRLAEPVLHHLCSLLVLGNDLKKKNEFFHGFSVSKSIASCQFNPYQKCFQFGNNIEIINAYSTFT
jgi:hypothetical protein